MSLDLDAKRKGKKMTVAWHWLMRKGVRVNRKLAGARLEKRQAEMAIEWRIKALEEKAAIGSKRSAERKKG